MKKLLVILLSVIMLFSFTACGKEEKQEDKKVEPINLEQYANTGSIPECKYTLGSDIETLKEELSAFAESEEGSESLYDVTEGEETVLITNGIYNFYYDKSYKDKNIDCIVSFETAYGFEIGESIITVREKLSTTKFKEEETNEDNTFFMFVPISGSVIKCEFEENTVMFVFEDNALCATAIYKNKFLN